jgi:hypothetical protein
MGRSKTGLKRAQPNPLYKETFIFQVWNIYENYVLLLVLNETEISEYLRYKKNNLKNYTV